MGKSHSKNIIFDIKGKEHTITLKRWDFLGFIPGEYSNNVLKDLLNNNEFIDYLENHFCCRCREENFHNCFYYEDDEGLRIYNNKPSGYYNYYFRKQTHDLSSSYRAGSIFHKNRTYKIVFYKNCAHINQNVHKVTDVEYIGDEFHNDSDENL